MKAIAARTWTRTTAPGSVIARWGGGSFRLGDAFHGDDRLGHSRPDSPLDLRGDGRVAAQELLGGLAALAEARLIESEPGACLGHDVGRHAHVEQAALLRDALAVHDVELGDPERRSDLVLDHLHPGPV